MRICHIISGDLWAGAEVMYYRLIKGLMSFHDIELMAILLNEGKLAEELRGLGIPVTILDESQMNFFQIVRQSRKIIERTSPDIIHSHRLKENILAYYSASSQKRKIILISTQHGMPEPIPIVRKKIKNNILLKYNYYILSKCFEFLIAVSNDMKNRLMDQYHFPEDKILVIYNGTEIYDHTYPEKNRNTFVIGSAGRFFPVKDYPLMVELASEMLRQTNNVRFELAGEGPDEEKILGLIRHYNIQQAFTLRGFIGNMETFYEGLDIYINTSRHEGLPMSILEAMAHGLPVVAMNRGGLKEIIDDGIQGFLVEERDSIAFAEKCLRILGDKELRLKMGSESRELIQRKFSFHIMAGCYHDLYRQMVKNRSV